MRKDGGVVVNELGLNEGISAAGENKPTGKGHHGKRLAKHLCLRETWGEKPNMSFIESAASGPHPDRTPKVALESRNIQP
jgi:hypothetical protein